MPAPAVAFAGDEMSARFDSFGVEAYDLFLRFKGLPEPPTVDYDPVASSYTLTAPARFAAMLGVQAPPPAVPDLPVADHLYDDQAAILGMALDAKRFACWCDCGWGKTPLGLEYARHVIHRTGKGFLITTLNEIVDQWVDEADKFYGKTLPVRRLKSRAEMKGWLGSGVPELAITNYEKWNPESLADQIVKEASKLGGISLDEASRLKASGGKQKWALIKSCRGIEYKLNLTATPAPNDVMEFASQASFLEKMRSEGEILWTYFTRDEKTHRWNVKPHARTAFFTFMAGWSIYVRDPRRYGWRLGMAEVPKPEIVITEVKATPEQMEERAKLTSGPTGQLSFLDDVDTNAIQRVRLSQVGKGFLYSDVEGKRKARRIPSLKPGVVADLVRADVAAGLQVLVWTEFDAEAVILAELLRDVEFRACNACNRPVPKVGLCTGCGCPESRSGDPADVAFGGTSPVVATLTGKTPKPRRPDIVKDYKAGKHLVLITRAKVLGWGMNLQNVGSMVFSGWSDSYESYYQALRRAYRQGQTRRLRVHLPVVPELEGDMLENLWRKQADHEAAIAEMEGNYVRARRVLIGGGA